jgi:pimeloyl-ACP methyl ester carboxylesterase
MAIIREHLAAKGLGLHNDLQNEASIVGNFPQVLMFWHFGSEEQRREFVEPMITGEKRVAFVLTEPNHGSDALYLETTARREGSEWVIDGAKRFNTGLHTATHDLVFARTGGKPGSPRGLTCFVVPTDAAGFRVEFMWWTFNMPTDHAEVLREDKVDAYFDGLFRASDADSAAIADPEMRELFKMEANRAMINSTAGYELDAVLAASDWSEWFRRPTSKPMWFVHGAEDQITLNAQLSYVAARLDNVTPVHVPDAGSLVLFQEPALVVGLIADLLNERVGS